MSAVAHVVDPLIDIPFEVPTQEELDRVASLVKKHEHLGWLNCEIDDVPRDRPDAAALLVEERDMVLRSLEASDRHWHGRLVPFEELKPNVYAPWPLEFRGTGRKCVMRDPRDVVPLCAPVPDDMPEAQIPKAAKIRLRLLYYAAVYRRRQSLLAMQRALRTRSNP